MVLILSEADDPDAKLLPPSGPPVTRVTVDESEVADSDDDSTVHLIPDPPPSYCDVQRFRERSKAEELACLFRAKRRFWLALGIALSLCAIPAISAAIFTRSRTSIDVEIPEPTTSEPAPSSTLPSERPWNPGWGRPGEGPGGHGPRPGGGDHGRERPDEGRHPEYPHPPDDEEDETIDCSDWIPGVDPYSDGNESVFLTNYTLSNTQPISIRSYLERAGGSIRVSVDDKLPADDAYVEIMARNITSEGLKDAEVCVVHGPRWRSGLHFRAKGQAAEAASYSIHLFISPRKHYYPGISLSLPRFSQVFDDFSYGEFRFVRIGGEDTSISVTSLAAQWMNVWTSNGSIDGTFTAKKRLDIFGNSDSVTVTANLCNEEREDPTEAHIMSSQGAINAKVVLCEKFPRARPSPGPHYGDQSRRQGEVGRYEVYVINSDSPISLQVQHSNPEQGSSLWLNVTNLDSVYRGKSHSMVTLDTGFEGNFAVKSSGEFALPVNVTSEEVTDEEGVARHVAIERVMNEGRLVSGKVYWDVPSPPSERRRSDVWVTTSGQGEASLLLPSN